MRLNLWLINVCLAAGAAYAGVNAYDTWREDRLAIHQPAESAPEQSGAWPRWRRAAHPPKARFEVIAAKNLFSSDRREPVVEVEPTASETVKTAPAKPPAPSGNVILYGVVLTDVDRRALVTETGGRNTARRRSRESQWVKEGDSIGNYLVAKIEPDQILLTEGERQLEVLLYDAANPKKRRTIRKNLQPTVMNVQTGAGDAPADATPKTAPASNQGQIQQAAAAAQRQAPPKAAQSPSSNRAKRATTTPSPAAASNAAEPSEPFESSASSPYANRPQSSGSSSKTTNPFQMILDKLKK